ncbi:hypothetical protein [Methylophilus sp. 5]|uniref:hypothetical protein n=1 Tax=Methylophilus sp. 5 TaxID=1112274 RepID=UPI0006851E03|nr:hypothetical protein [Methylophilus sp. 5]
MENFKWFDREFEFSALSGEVFSNNKYSETHVSSSGGGGHVDGQYGGHVAAAQVHSTVVTVHEFWIRDDAGKEHPINLRGIDVPLAVGQKITLLASGFVGKKQHFVLLLNHKAEKHWHLFKGREFVNYCLESEQAISAGVTKMLFKIAIFIAIYILMLNLTSGYVTLAMHIGLIIYCVNWYRSRAKRAKEFDAHVTKIAHSLY